MGWVECHWWVVGFLGEHLVAGWLSVESVVVFFFVCLVLVHLCSCCVLVLGELVCFGWAAVVAFGCVA